MLGNWDRVYQAAGVTAQDHIFFAFSFGPFLGFWTAFEAATRMGALAIPGGGMRSIRASAHDSRHARDGALLHAHVRHPPGRGRGRGRMSTSRKIARPPHHRSRRTRRQHSCDTRAYRKTVARRDGGRSSRHDGNRSGQLRLPRADRRAACDRILLHRRSDRRRADPDEPRPHRLAADPLSYRRHRPRRSRQPAPAAPTILRSKAESSAAPTTWWWSAASIFIPPRWKRCCAPKASPNIAWKCGPNAR